MKKIVLSALNQISSGAGIGAGLGAVNSMMTGQSSMIDGAMSGAVTGAALGAVGRYASMKYASGLNSFIFLNSFVVQPNP